MNLGNQDSSRLRAYAPINHVSAAHVAATSHPLSATISPNEEVKLATTKEDADLYECLAEVYGIIVSIDGTERAYLKDSIGEDEYTESCKRLLKQYNSYLQDPAVSDKFGNLDSFLEQWQLNCPRARERIRIGLPSTVHQPLHKPQAPGLAAANATLAVAASENFVTLLDAIKIGYVEKDALHPLLADVVHSVNQVTDIEFEDKGKIVQWLIKLNQMKVTEKLSEDEAREFQWDMTLAYTGFKKTL